VLQTEIHPTFDFPLNIIGKAYTKVDKFAEAEKHISWALKNRK
jgi:hypothetical protein